MTKKDYQAIARAIHATRFEAESAMSTAGVQATMVIAERLATVLAADNPRFDRERFIEACETGRTKGMPR